MFIVDSHVLRVLQRLGFVSRTADACTASEAVTAAMADWDADALLDLHVAMKRLGQLACHADAPDCRACPLIADCRAGRRGRRD